MRNLVAPAPESICIKTRKDQRAVKTEVSVVGLIIAGPTLRWRLISIQWHIFTGFSPPPRKKLQEPRDHKNRFRPNCVGTGIHSSAPRKRFLSWCIWNWYLECTGNWKGHFRFSGAGDSPQWPVQSIVKAKTLSLHDCTRSLVKVVSLISLLVALLISCYTLPQTLMTKSKPRGKLARVPSQKAHPNRRLTTTALAAAHNTVKMPFRV